MILNLLPVAVCLLALALLLVAERFDHRAGQAVAKLGASSAFVWAALVWGVGQTIFGQWILAGLALCWLGDALLLARGRGVGFQLGIGAFTLAHLCYAMACTRLPLDTAAALAGAALAGLGAWRALRWLGPHLPGDFRIPVRVYVGVISSMLVLAAAAVAGGAPALLGVGALGFALSDLSVARERFVSPGFVNVAWGLPAYFLSQLAIAWAAAHAV